jgi:hypothetical protein
MRLGAQLVGDLRKMLAEELRAGERAAMTAIRTETAEVKAELRQQVTTEPPRVCRRLFCLSYAAMAGCSSEA